MQDQLEAARLVCWQVKKTNTEMVQKIVHAKFKIHTMSKKSDILPNLMYKNANIIKIKWDLRTPQAP